MAPIAITIPEAMALGKMGKTKIFELLKSGAIKRRKIGAKTLILVDDLNEFLRNLPTD